MLRRLTALIGLVLAVVLAGGVLAAVDMRAARAAAERAEAVRVAEQAYADAVLPILLGVADARSPVQDLLGLYDSAQDETADDAAAAVAYDVLVHGALTADLDDALTGLERLDVPASRTQLHGRLARGLQRMRQAAESMAQPDNEEIGAELTQFDAAGGALDRVVARELGEDVVVPPTADLPQERVTKAGVLYRWALACTTASFEVEAVPEPVPDDVEGLAQAIAVYGDALQRTVDAVLDAPAPKRDAALVERDVRSPVRALAPAVELHRRLAEALRARDRAAAEQAFVDLDRTSASLEAVARGTQAYGSQSCAVYFDPGVLLDPPEAGDDTTTT